MRDIKIIALDLDGTLLNSDMKLTSANMTALQRAANSGIEIVPTTGRFYGGMPEAVRNLPFIHYAITINGAAVYDICKEKDIAKAEIPVQRAIEIMSYLDSLPLIYDCYMDNLGWMTRSMREHAEAYAPNAHYLKMILELRRPVPELKAYLHSVGHNIQKIQAFVKDMALHSTLMESLSRRFPDMAVSTSVRNNIEINVSHANKGEAISQLAAYLGCDISQILAFGDGLNDLSMIRKAGIGVAMANACPEVLAAADFITTDCNHDGVAAGIEKYCFKQ